MLNRLTYDLKFSSTGKRFSQKIDFKPGLTVISGRNEQGKSLILEMIRYAWFGVEALRGQLSDYEIINVDMTWETKGETYTVSRHGSTQTLNKTKAVGASAVNKAILGILGIGLKVFDITASAKQGELDQLTARMLPTERRKMVDGIIGLDILENVEKLCKSESNSQKRLRDDLAKRLIEPEEPVKPENYTASLILDKQYREQIRIETEKAQLLRVTKPMMPVEPDKGVFEDDVTEHENLRGQREAERAGVERALRAIPIATFTRQDTDYAAEYYRQRELGPVPTISRSEAEDWLKVWEEIERLAQSVHCPNCGVDFIPGEDHTLPKVIEPFLSQKQILIQLKQLDKWEGFKGKLLSEPPVMTEAELKSAVLALSQVDIREGMERQLEGIPSMEDRSEELKRKLQWDKDHQRYTIEIDRYLERLTEWSDATDKLNQMPEVDVNLENKLQVARIYEEQKRSYDANVVRFKEAEAELDALNEQAEAYNKGAEALKFVRSQVKQHLVPSLNTVASHLLSEMTNGQRTKITVDEDFEVSVDGQPVRTLSGSGVSVVNLALRIALGQVLTQKIIPIFLADEIDHDMDADRAAATHTAIKSLTKTLKQIIVVSHKDIEGDNKIGV